MGSKRIRPKYNWFDKVRSLVDPVGAHRSALARGVQASMSSFRSADKGRTMLKNASPGLGSARWDENPEIPRLRELSRDAVRNQPVAAGAVTTVDTKAIGGGLRCQPMIDEVAAGITREQADELQREFERRWRLWSKDPQNRCDADQRFSWDELCSLAYRSERVNGDVFIQWVRRARPDWPFSLQAKLIEADRVENPSDRWDGQAPPKGYPESHRVWSGVEMTASGMPVAYWVADEHPGDWYGRGSRTWRRIPRTNRMGEPIMSHFFHPARVGSVRGVPWLSSVLELLKTVTEYMESEAAAALIASYFTMFVKSEGGGGLDELMGTSGTENTSEPGELELGQGIINDLAPGEEIEAFNPTRPNSNVEGFFKVVFREVGAGLGLPYSLLMKSFEASYSASRGETNEAWEFITCERLRISTRMYDPAYRMVITESIATGAHDLVPEEFWTDPVVRSAILGVSWTGPAQRQIDEVKAIKSAAERIAADLSSEEIEAARIGNDYYEVLAQKAAAQRKRKELGLDAAPRVEPDASRFEPEPDASEDEEEDGDNEDGEE